MSEVTATEVVKKTAKAPVDVNISDVLKMLEDSKSREEVFAHYGLNKRQGGVLFQHPKLKGKKTHFSKDGAKLVAFNLIDDAPDAKEYVAKERKPRTKKVKVVADAATVDTSTQSVEQSTQEQAPVAEQASASTAEGTRGGW